MRYLCTECNYETERKFCYEQHLRSKKHALLQIKKKKSAKRIMK